MNIYIELSAFVVRSVTLSEI